MLDIYVVSLSSAWISNSVLMVLMGRVPKGAILLLEDLDAAFTRSVSRQDDGGGQQVEGPELPPKRRSRDKVCGFFENVGRREADGRCFFSFPRFLSLQSHRQ
jgi:chaperone BCS1